MEIMSVHIVDRLIQSSKKHKIFLVTVYVLSFVIFPSRSHPHAQHAAEAAECAGAQNKFWEMHDILYEHQQALDDKHLEEYA